MTDPADHTYLAANDLPRIPDSGRTTAKVFENADLRVIIIGLAAGAQLAEHHAPGDAIVEVVIGQVELTLGTDAVRARAGAWVHMPAGLRHGLKALEPTNLRLTLLRRGGGRDPRRASGPTG